MYIFCDDFKPSHTGMFCFTFCFPSIHTTLKCCVQFVLRWQKFAIINADFFSFIIIRLFFCFFFFFFFLVMNDEHVYLASHKNSDRSCLHMYRLWNSFLVTLPKLILNVCLYYNVQCPKENLEKNKASENIVNVVYLECLIFGGNWFFNKLEWI